MITASAYGEFWARDYDYISRCTRAYITRVDTEGYIERERATATRPLSRRGVTDTCAGLCRQSWIRRMDSRGSPFYSRLGTRIYCFQKALRHYVGSLVCLRVLSTIKVLHILFSEKESFWFPLRSSILVLRVGPTYLRRHGWTQMCVDRVEPRAKGIPGLCSSYGY